MGLKIKGSTERVGRGIRKNVKTVVSLPLLFDTHLSPSFCLPSLVQLLFLVISHSVPVYKMHTYTHTICSPIFFFIWRHFYCNIPPTRLPATYCCSWLLLNIRLAENKIINSRKSRTKHISCCNRTFVAYSQSAFPKLDCIFRD